MDGIPCDLVFQYLRRQWKDIGFIALHVTAPPTLSIERRKKITTLYSDRAIIKLVRESGGILKLYGLQIKVRELFFITMLDSVVEIFEEEDIAIQSFQKKQDI